MLTAASIGSLAFIVTMLIHEALGHSVVCLALGGSVALYPVSMQCTIESRAMVAAGSIANLVAGIALLFLVRRASGHWRYFLWLTASFNLLNAAGYLMTGALTGFGDWSELLHNRSWPLRIAIALAAALLYYAFMRVIANMAGGFLGLTRAPYLAAAITALVAASLSRMGAGYLAAAAAASLGANFGILVIRDWGPPVHTALPPSTPWIATSLTATAAFIILVGPGVRIPR